MKIAVTCENDMVFRHFGKTSRFAIYEAEDGKVTSKTYLTADNGGHTALVDLIAENGVNVLICGGIGGCAREALEQTDIQLVPGVSGNVDVVAHQWLSGELKADLAAGACHHHDDEHGEHHCGNH